MCGGGWGVQARKYGVRAAMPGFIARKLCPQLVFVKPDFKKYEHYCHLTREGARNFPKTGTSNDENLESGIGNRELGFGIWDLGFGIWDLGCGSWRFVFLIPHPTPPPVLFEYDPHLIATSLDEAYLDITAVCTERSITGGEVRNAAPGGKGRRG